MKIKDYYKTSKEDYLIIGSILLAIIMLVSAIFLPMLAYSINMVLSAANGCQ